MTINRSAVGRTFGPVPMPYTPRDVMTYALAVGADETELPFVYELHGPLVVPSCAVLPSFKAAINILADLGVEGKPTVHGEQRLRLVRRVPPTGTFETEVRVNGIQDKGSGALIDMRGRTSVGGEAVCENALTFFVLGEGGFGGERGPKADTLEPPARPADCHVEMKTSSTQGILFRLIQLPDAAMAAAVARGERDPHIDPEGAVQAGFDRPLLQGLCTFGYLTMAAIRGVTSGDPSGIRGVRARFAAPVHAGEMLVTEFWRDGRRLVAQMRNQAGAVVLSNAVVDLA